ncbi:MAG: hypothetical protein CSA76_04360 [Spirochaetales bacterium]|nr:MAG: hypothetical protein CSA76_04360 [Spirochaetales bacterium]
MQEETSKDKVSSRHIRSFVDIIRRLLHGSRLFIDEGAIVEVLINPASGLLKTGLAHNKMMRHLHRLAAARSSAQTPRPGLEIRFHETRSSSHAGEKAVELVGSLAASPKPGHRVLILAGGDGFYNDILGALLRDVPDIMKDICLFRLPMGTGNDNADAASVEEALAILCNASGFHKDSIITIQTARNKLHYAFNVASFGLDAYVCLLTNKMKKLAGPTVIYKIFANVAVLMYEWIWPLQQWKIDIYTEEGIVNREGRFLLNVFGRKGPTRYGGGMKVLPGDENYLLIDPLSLLEKLRLKPLFYRGAHRGVPFAKLYKTDKITLHHQGPVLIQLDGEVTRLEVEDFPVTIQKEADILNILQ